MDGYTFWREKLNSAKFILAPMVDQSELAWRMLSRNLGAHLCYTPMFHASVFSKDATYRKDNFTTCSEDRPLIVQFCSDDPDTFYNAAKIVEKDCDAVDLNLGCPQGIARRGHYGSYLQDEWDLIYNIINNAVKKLSIPVTAKIRVFDDIDKTVKYAKMLEDAGVSILTVHGRIREQKGEHTGLASWAHIKAVKDNVKIPVFANGNILFLKDVYDCLEQTGCDGVMIAEGSLHNPALFVDKYPTAWSMSREYLNFAKKYETPLTWVRGHIFKMCRRVFDIHIDLREKLAKAKTLELIEEVLAETEKLCLNNNKEYTVEYSGNQSFKYYQCQPYLRPLKISKTDSNNESPHHQQKNDEEAKNAQFEDDKRIEIQNIRKKRKLEKLARKTKASMRPQSVNSKKTRYEKCSYCSNPRSGACDHNACRQCCRNKAYVENLECKGHLFKKRDGSKILDNEKVSQMKLENNG